MPVIEKIGESRSGRPILGRHPCIILIKVDLATTGRVEGFRQGSVGAREPEVNLNSDLDLYQSALLILAVYTVGREHVSREKTASRAPKMVCQRVGFFFSFPMREQFIPWRFFVFVAPHILPATPSAFLTLLFRLKKRVLTKCQFAFFS